MIVLFTNLIPENTSKFVQVAITFVAGTMK